MYKLKDTLEIYLDYCEWQKRLDNKTLNAYRTDLRQFSDYIPVDDIPSITPPIIEDYLAHSHQSYKPKTVKRKIASLKAFFHYLEYKDLIVTNPFNKLQLKFREPVVLPKTIPLHTVELFLVTIYRRHRQATTAYQRRSALRDAAVAELLFSTGMRISELCSLTPGSVNLYDGTILIYGKGSKERRLQVGNNAVLKILREYREEFDQEIMLCRHFFANQSGKALSDQSVRRMINKYCEIAAIEQHITPHMFRHTFATCLLEADVDIRYIQEMLGHSSINITEIYTHVAVGKTKDILLSKHPRKDFVVG